MSWIMIPALIAWTVIPEPWDALEKHLGYGWGAPFLPGWPSAVAVDGMPLTAAGNEPLPGWGSYDTLRVLTPLEAGVWGAGRWEMDFSSHTLPESSFASSIGLIENTGGANRYSAGLRRPLFSMLSIDLHMARDDTLSDQRLVIGSGAFETGGRGWQGEEDGYALWSGLGSASWTAKVTFAHFRSGSGYWELAGTMDLPWDEMDIMTAAAVSMEGDSAYSAEGHLRAGMPLGALSVILRGDLEDDDGELAAGGTAGLSARPGPIRLQAGVALPPGDEAVLIGAAGTGPLEAFVQVEEGSFEGGLQAGMSGRSGLLNSGVFLLGDTVRFSGTFMPALRWGRSGRIYGGLSWEVADSDTVTSGTIDLRTMFTLGRFAFIFAAEDVLDSWRSYSFGVTWSFSDRRRSLEEGNGI
ncbi:MAG: hypothetical protein AVO35_04390 [Candidatus Aegiribacteria sp. MLS_C]|nr:MAG: hypothetical protein AVO35_04390 [Candidatus Aegiribacteria sp. MLS_C]